MLNYVKRKPTFSIVTGALAIMAGAFLFSENVKADAEIDKICGKADARYEELFGDAKPADGTVVIKLYKYTFCPPNLEIKKGTKVQFINVDKRTSHSVWFKDKGDDESERFFPEELVEMFFNEVGEFDYLCGPHWESDNMRGSLTIIP